MTTHLVFDVRLHDRFHGMAFGASEWPPSPARLFQALVAGAARRGGVPEDVLDALRWLETLAPPRIVAPLSQVGAEQTLFVPNNDLDSVGGDPARAADIRVAKRVVPRLFPSGASLLYVWSYTERAEHARTLSDAAELLYQLGRGVDMAWARARELTEAELEQLLQAHPGELYEPSPELSARGGTQCPTPGSLESLARRFDF